MKHAKLGVSMAFMVALGSASAVAVMAQGAPTDEPRRGPLLAHFDEIDSDRDGKLSRDELLSFDKTGRGPDGGPRECRLIMIKEGRGKLKSAKAEGDARPPFGSPPLAMLDKNSDGKLSHEEFLNGQADMFERLDANKDGFLTPEERPDLERKGCPPPSDMPPPTSSPPSPM